MYIIAGLGNIGSKYQFTKHNFGFLLIDEIIKKYKIENSNKKFYSEFSSGKIANNKIFFLKPQEYMNNSGKAVLSCSSFYKIPSDKIIILHDDLDIAFGKVKAKIGGGNAGHNGLKDIDEKIGENYIRIRLGIGRPKNKECEISDYVLSRFTDNEMKVVNQINQKVANNLPFIFESCDKFINQFAKV